MRQKLLWTRLSKFCLVAVALLFSGSPLLAQAKNQFGSDFRNRPTVSPYLSTMDNGSGYGALNYFNIVRPQQRARQANRELQRELHEVENNQSYDKGQPLTSNDTKPITSGRMLPTGHTTSFGNTGGYFGGTANGGNSANGFGRNGRRR